MAELLQTHRKTAGELCQSRAIVVTSCTTRKRALDPAVTLSARAHSEPLSTIAERWMSLLERARRSATAGTLYVGRAMTEVKRVSRSLGTEFYVVSAGLGLVHESDLVPNYDLTVARGQGPLSGALHRSGAPVAHWWRLLANDSGRGTPLADLVRKSDPQIVLLALPSSYLGLVAEDLASLNVKTRQRLRIFTSKAGLGIVQKEIANCVLPYDDRLEGLPGFDGTRADFPQRALRHFVLELRGHTLALDDAKSTVDQALGGLKPRTMPVRARRTDDQIIDLIRSHWHGSSGNSARLLRLLRDQEFVACEQSRFRDLWRLVKKEQIDAKMEDKSAST